MWTSAEFETLRVLHRAGARVPRPFGCSAGAVAMEWIGNVDQPAPQLKNVNLDRDQAQSAFDQVIADIELWLACNIVHGDLSAYNLLWDGEQLVAIDFPQACDPRFNTNAAWLLARDIQHVSQAFARWGVQSDPGALADDLWDRFTRGQL
jgi:RIO kinase 1